MASTSQGAKPAAPSPSPPHSVSPVVLKLITILSQDAPTEQVGPYPDLPAPKLPNLSALNDPNLVALYSARFSAYHYLGAVAGQVFSDTISETHQLALVQALRRDLANILTPTPGQQLPKPASLPSASHLLKLNEELGNKAVDALGGLMANEKLGPIFTRKVVGQVVRLLTNLTFFATKQGLILSALWTMMVWKIGNNVLPMISRGQEAVDRNEEAVLNAQGWPAYMSWTAWKHVDSTLADRNASLDTISYIGPSAPIVPAAQVYEVIQSETSSRLVSVIDCLTYALIHTARVTSATSRAQAAGALMRLLRTHPQAMMALQHRWMHALYPTVFDAAVAAKPGDVALATYIELSNHLSAQPAYSMTSAIAFRLFVDPLTDASGATAAPLLAKLQEMFASQDKDKVVRALNIWGPMVLLLGPNLFYKKREGDPSNATNNANNVNNANTANETINLVLKLLQSSFVRLEPALRLGSFKAWEYLISAFRHAKSGLRMIKRLKLVLLPIARTFGHEDDLGVLHTAFDTFSKLLVALKSHIEEDWTVLLGQPLHLLLKNPAAHLRYHSSLTSLPSSQHSLPSPDISLQLSLLHKYGLLVATIMKGDLATFPCVPTGFDPHATPHFVPLNAADLTNLAIADLNRWDVDVVVIEAQLHHGLCGQTEDLNSSPLCLAPPSVQNASYTQSFLSLALTFITSLISAAAVHSSSDSQPAFNLVDISVAKEIWNSLCCNLARRHQRLPSNKDTSMIIEGLEFDPQNLASWAVLHLMTSRLCSPSPDSRIWDQFMETCLKTLTVSYAALAHDLIHEREPVLVASTFSRLVQWITTPHVTIYEDNGITPTSMEASSDWVLPIANFYFGTRDLVAYALEYPSEAMANGMELSNPSYNATQRTKKAIFEILTIFFETMPRAPGALTVLHTLIKPLKPTSTFSLIGQLSQDVLASQGSSLQLQLMLLRLDLPFSLWNTLAIHLKVDIQNTATIYPKQAYQVKSTISSPKSKVASSMDDNSDRDGTLRNATLPSVPSMLISPAKSTVSRVSEATTTTGGSASSSHMSSDSESVHVTESKHPRYLFSLLNELVLFPLQHAKQILRCFSFDIDDQPGSQAVTSAIVSLLTPELLNTVHDRLTELIRVVERISKNRFVDPSHLGGSNTEQSTGSLLSLTAIWHLTLLQFLQQLRDATTFRKDRLFDSSNTSQSTPQLQGSVTPLLTLIQQARMWYLRLWSQCFAIFVDGIATQKPFEHSAFSLDQWHNIIAPSTIDPSFKSVSSGAQHLEDQIITPLMATTKAKQMKQHGAATLSLSPYFREDLEKLFELSVPDWNLLWNASASDKQVPNLDFPTLSNLSDPDGSGDESLMSLWSKFCRKVLNCQGMTWRAGMRLSKFASKGSSEFAAHSQALLEDVVTVSRLFIENWCHGNNLLLDVLPLVDWGMANDKAVGALVKRGASALIPVLKLHLDQIAGAMMAGVSRSFFGLNAKVPETQGRKIAATNSFRALFKRSAALFEHMFQSNRSSVRASAWMTWTHSLGMVGGLDPLTIPASTALVILTAHEQHPQDVLLADADRWIATLRPAREFSSPQRPALPPSSPTKVNINNASSPFVPKSAPAKAPIKDEFQAPGAKSATKPPIANKPSLVPPKGILPDLDEENIALSQGRIQASSATLPMAGVPKPPTDLASWLDMLRVLQDSSKSIFEDPSMTVPKILSAQKQALELVAALTERASRG